ncbi:MAG: substrate-binding domain-containing protein [Prevotella sp.]|nr:substrate-binding domain-containing protein [Prevotella sp.]
MVMKYPQTYLSSARPAACLCVLLVVLLCLSCSQRQAKYVIGVSQCSADIWREKQNSELRMGAYCNKDDVELRFAAAYDSDERQVQQIDSLLGTGIDLLIVAPNQVQTISPAIDRAYDSGIPVIVFERKTSSEKYTAFISADNYEMGRTMGDYVAQRLQGRGQVLEVMGLQGSSPAIERHLGVADALKAWPDIRLVATLQGDWTEESGYEATRQWLDSVGTDVGPIDFVFGQNDRMAMGARKAAANSSLSTLHSSLYCGIDGLPGEGGGIRLVEDSILDATYIYPTHGDRLLQVAVDILDGRPFDKEIRLMSALVTRQNAHALQMQSEEMARQSDYLDRLHQRADNYLQQLDTQHIINVLSLVVIILLLLTIFFFYLYHRGKMNLQRERVVNNLWNVETQQTLTQQTLPQPLPEGRGVDSPEDGESDYSPPLQGGDGGESVGGLFITRFKEVVEKRLSESDLSVEDLAAEMNLSRVQLYRKVKSVTDSSPVELLRTARLNRGYQLLLTTDKTISEVAYAVGFTAPSYFTKCFKEEFGHSPTDMKR